MSIYYKFKSAKAFDSITIEGQFISVGNLKERIFESKHLGRGTDFDLMVSNAQTNEEYLDEAAMIPKNTSVLIRRLPGRPRMPIVTQPDLPKNAEHMAEDVQPPSSMLVGNSSAAMTIADESEWDEFGGDLYAIPEVVPDQLANPVVDVSSASKIDEENKIKSLIETSALDWSGQSQDGYGGGREFGRGMGGRMMAGRGFGRGGFERKIPPAGYVCYRCKIPGHFIQHCPTNGDPNYDVRKVKPPTGIPKSMLMATPDGSYALPSGAVAVLQPNEAAFEKEIEGMPSTRPASEIPPELRCPFCKEVMKDAVLTGTCCFRSFCDKCIREYIISKSMCVCGATNILADDLLPNKTLRETISRIVESTTSSTENVGNVVQVQDMESAHQMLSKNSSPTLSVLAKDEPKMTPDHSLQVKIGDVEEDAAPSDEGKAVRVNDTAHSLKKNTVHSMEQKSMTGTDHFEATPELTNGKNPLSPKISSVPEVQEKLPVGEQGKKKKKKASLPGSAADMQWRGIQDLGPETYGGMPMGPSAYNPYWGGGMPMGMDAYMTPLAPAMPYMGYAPGPFNVPFGGMLPPQQYAAQGFMMGSFPQGDISKQGFNSMSMNNGPPMSKQEFEAMKDNIRRKQKFEWEMHNERERYRDGRGVTGKEVSHSRVDVSPRKSKPRIVAERTERPPLRHQENRLHRQHSPSPSRRRSPPPSAPKQRRLSSERYGDNDETRREDRSKTYDQNQNQNHREKASVFTRINLLNSEDSSDRETKNGKRKVSSSSDVSAAGPDHGGSTKDRYDSHHHCRSTHHRHDYDAGAANNGYKMNGDDEEEEEEYHFKRRPSSSSSRREERRSSRVSKEGDRRWH